jgi:hypothetical protein
MDEDHPLELLTSIGLSSILTQRVVHDGIELVVNDPELMAIYFRDFARCALDVPMNQGFPRLLSSDLFMENSSELNLPWNRQ